MESPWSNEALLCAARSRHRRGNIISMKRLYPGKAGQKHTQRRELPVFKKKKKNHPLITCSYYFLRYSLNLLKLIFMVLGMKYRANIKNAEGEAVILDDDYVVM